MPLARSGCGGRSPSVWVAWSAAASSRSLGLSVQITGGAAPLAFLLAGLVALLTARSYALLSTSYPSRGGTVTFVNRAFGPGMFSGGINVLLWLSYIVMLALYSQAFGGYAASFLPTADREPGQAPVLTV